MSLRAVASTSFSRTFTSVFRSQSASAHCVSEFNKTYTDGVVHVSSVNAISRERSVLRLQASDAKNRRLIDLPRLPKEAIEGLKNALIQCSRPPKQLQHEADQLNEKLSQRRFPATPEEIKEARKAIKKKLQQEDSDIDNDAFNQKIRDSKEQHVRKETERILRRCRYNWRPIDFATRESAAVYALARLSPNYAEVREVLSEFSRNDFVPQSILDYGSGIGSVFWAANERWGRKVEEYHMVDPNDEINKFAMDILRGSGNNGINAFVHPNITFRRYLSTSPDKTFDLVVAHRVLVEIASSESRIDLITSLWNKTNKFLVIIDSDLEESFSAVMEARDYILLSGCELHLDETRQLLESFELLNEKTETILNDRNITDLERFHLLKEMMPPETVLPTRLAPGFVFAPCPHDQGCPKLSLERGHRTCKFPTLLQDLRADGKPSKRADGTVRSSFSYIIMQKGMRSCGEPSARVLQAFRGKGHTTFVACTPFIGLQEFTVSKRARNIYQCVKPKKDGDLLPINIKAVLSESSSNFFDESVKSLQLDD